MIKNLSNARRRYIFASNFKDKIAEIYPYLNVYNPNIFPYMVKCEQDPAVWRKYRVEQLHKRCDTAASIYSSLTKNISLSTKYEYNRKEQVSATLSETFLKCLNEWIPLAGASHDSVTVPFRNGKLILRWNSGEYVLYADTALSPSESLGALLKAPSDIEYVRIPLFSKVGQQLTHSIVGKTIVLSPVSYTKFKSARQCIRLFKDKYETAPRVAVKAGIKNIIWRFRHNVKVTYTSGSITLSPIDTADKKQYAKHIASWKRRSYFVREGYAMIKENAMDFANAQSVRPEVMAQADEDRLRTLKSNRGRSHRSP